MLFSLNNEIGLALQFLVRLLEPSRSLVQLLPAQFLPLGEKPGNPPHHVVEENLKKLFQFQRWVHPPLKNDMRHIHNAHNNRGNESAAQSEPECGKNYRQIVKPLEDVVQHRQMERGKVMQQADHKDESSQHHHTHGICTFHGDTISR